MLMHEPAKGGQVLDLSTPVNQCIDVTFSVDGTQLYISRSASCHGNEYTYASSGPSSIEVRAATGGPAKTIFSAPYGILSLRVATSTSMLFIKDPANEEINFAGHFGWNMDQPWAKLIFLSIEKW